MKLYFSSMAALCAVAACPAQAKPSVELELGVSGHISSHCGISVGSANVTTVLTDAPGSKSVSLSVDCNQPLSITMKSLNGGLLHDAMRGVDATGSRYPGFAGFLPYIATFGVTADHMTPLTVASQAMRNAVGGSLGGTPYAASGELRISWTPTLPLLAGTFRDTIEIRVSGAGEDDDRETDDHEDD